ncbi:PepSY domain-containing protein [Sinorhizobium arboris]|uniref:PepSY domain-containing protein n=1 Tax=Sinorhizobium arboris TaxID=76745 RepID=UPI000411E09B|nr:PepSY domain-containing protein [Sinorhizobium arboris]
MKNIILAAAVLMGTAAAPLFAQTAGNTPAIATPGTENPTAPVPGENSFTEDQARERMEKAGYTGIKGLKLDDQGIWRATATKNGRSVPIALDFQGNVVAL